jgi:hypothetical protein
VGADLPTAKGGDSVLKVYFERHFGNPADSGGEFQASMTERLFMNNHPQVRDLARKGGLAGSVAGSSGPVEERVDRLFLSILSRPPRPAERQRVAAYLTANPKPELIEQAIWALLNSSEFRFNH